MNYLEVYNELLALNLKVNSLQKHVKKLHKSCFLLSICVIWLGILAIDQDKRTSKLEKIRLKKLKKEFENGEKLYEDDFFDEEIEDYWK